MKTSGEQVDGPAWGVDEGNRVRTTALGPGPLLGAKACNWAPDRTCLKRLRGDLSPVHPLRVKPAPRQVSMRPEQWLTLLSPLPRLLLQLPVHGYSLVQRGKLRPGHPEKPGVWARGSRGGGAVGDPGDPPRVLRPLQKRGTKVRRMRTLPLYAPSLEVDGGLLGADV